MLPLPGRVAAGLAVMSVAPIGATPLPWLLPCLVGSHSRKRCHGCGMVSVPQMVAAGLSVMPVAPIDANGLALVVSELTEGKGSQPTENPSDKERNALALVVA